MAQPYKPPSPADTVLDAIASLLGHTLRAELKEELLEKARARQ